MAHLSSSGDINRRSAEEVEVPPVVLGGAIGDPVMYETVVDDELEEENAPFCKRVKCPSITDHVIAAPSQCKPLIEASPLGLRLKKSPSLLELIQTRISHGKTSSAGSSSLESTNPRESAARSNSATAAPFGNDRLKASNFPALLLSIGDWKYVSQYEGDLVAKCYFSKQKLVWEILDRGLKSKIEIQWSDIMGLNVKFPEDRPASMTIALARQPLFFRETDPQPRKHTLWQSTADFTDSQASIHRQHFVQVPLGVLNKHFEKLIQCDSRLCYLSRQPKIVLDSPYFLSPPQTLQDSKDERVVTSISTFPGASSAVQACSDKTEQANLARSKNLLNEAPSPSAATGASATGGSVRIEAESLVPPKNWEQLVMQGVSPSMSVNDIMNHIGSCITGQGIGENRFMESHEILKDIAQQLLGDSLVTCSDEKSLMRRVNSLCALLHQDGEPAQLNTTDTGFGGSEEPHGVSGSGYKQAMGKIPSSESQEILQDIAQHLLGDSQVTCSDEQSLMKRVDSLCALLRKDEPEVLKDSQPQELSGSSSKPALPRKGSDGELFRNLPKIASLPYSLFDISENGENQGR